MRRSTTSVGTDPSVSRPVLGTALLAELIAAAAVLWPAAAPAQSPSPPPSALPAVSVVPAVSAPDPVTSVVLPDGRTAQLLGLGGERTAALLGRLDTELGTAATVVTGFWGPDWPHQINLVVAGSDDQFRVLAGGAEDIAATTTAQRIMFAPGAADMSRPALRIVLRHELFHYASRARTAPDAPRWLTEGVADYVGRPAEPLPGPTRAAELAQLPTDADLDSIGAARSLAYDRAWWFSRYVADRYGPRALRDLYLRACGFGHPDVGTAVHDVLGIDLDQVLTDWRQWLSR
ncbi:peptidase [Mycobacterium aquaticum]|uniref:Peptidase n=1 Tax=Mycobacterium aquaticum TaxID=1927124 RepID=A0A1X0AR61_9MYCO|nr:peptidase [Mycobacterium aquaticum]ORA32522.1 peptidase [Mycobacterium aquaticum]